MSFRLTSTRTFPIPRSDAYDAVLALPLPTLFSRRHGPLPPVREVRGQSGAWGSHVGQTRTVVTADGGTMREKLTVVDPPRAFAYELEEITGPLRPLIKRVDGRWNFDSAGTGDGVRTVVRGLTLVQIDPISAVAPSADLVAWSRLGSRYSPADLRAALEQHTLLELRAMIRPSEDLALYRADMEAGRRGELSGWRAQIRKWVEANDRCRRDILNLLSTSGPLPSRELPDTCAKPWGSTGWTNNKNVTQLLECMVMRGEVAIAGRKGRDRLWDLAERVYPDEPVIPLDEAQRTRDQRRLRALGIARARGPECPVEPLDVCEAGEPAVIEGVRGQWRVDPSLLGQPFSGRAALLSPFDRLVHDRKRMVELFEFEYQLEMYKPVATRRWGYYALPILYGDRLVGKLDAKADHKAGVLQINAVHQDAPFNKATSAAVDRETKDLARWLELDVARAD